jgi:hypothetical protein
LTPEEIRAAREYLDGLQAPLGMNLSAMHAYGYGLQAAKDDDPLLGDAIIEIAIARERAAIDALAALPTSPEIQRVHDAWTLALRENLYAIQRVQEGIRSNDSETIFRGASLNTVGTMFMDQAIAERDQLEVRIQAAEEQPK